MALRKAKRHKLKVPILLTGASGSGKTVSSLLIAKGIVDKMFPDLPDDERWDKIAVIDTEHCRSEMYCDSTIGDTHIGSFNIYDLVEPYTVERYIQGFNECKQAGCEVVIVDSITHAWSGEGGILNKVDKLGGQFQAWSKVKPDEQAFLKMFFDQDVHVIATVRSKQGYEVTRTDTGKVNIEKIGLKPDQKDGLEYECAIVFQLYEDHTAEATKDNTNSFSGRFVIDSKIGGSIYDWAEQGVDLKAEKQKKIDHLITQIQNEAMKSEKAQAALKDIILKVGNIPLESFPINALEKTHKFLQAANISNNEANKATEKEQ
ncbi:AAA family ATPase [Aerococcus urinae]|uniref:AAA family ATPase n=1 Tax=Aerococcus urinae TaxID=1376 RepID=UPI00254FA488|nr:AAA family ATPase [Aerococcus urinae]MDK7716055.1 AAA family ATPase [Aerococcus urinae]